MRHQRVKLLVSAAAIGAALVLSFCSFSPPAAFARGGHGGGGHFGGGRHFGGGQPTPHQQSAFDALQSAAKTAASNLDSSCPYDMPETVSNRLDAVIKRLDALSEAVTIVKPPLMRFYDTLNDEQKARFNVIGSDNADDNSQDNARN